MLNLRSVLLFSLASFSLADESLHTICTGENVCTKMTESEVHSLIDSFEGLGVGFFDVTGHEEVVPRVMAEYSFPAAPQMQDFVSPLLSELDPSNLMDTMATLSSFHNRFYLDSTGVDSQKWLLEEFAALGAGHDGFSVELFEHSDWPQPSVIGTIQGETDEVVVIGAHADSIISFASPGKRMPGADDDASGVANMLEAFRVLAEHDFKPKRSIHFMGYAAEEVGLRGSQDVVAAYQAQGVDVAAVLQVEMSGYSGNNPSITVLKDFVNPELRDLTIEIAEEYCNIPIVVESCGYGCSDHASWEKQGYAAACIAEAGPYSPELNPHMHKTTDLVDELDADFCLEYTKLTLAFAVELSMY